MHYAVFGHKDIDETLGLDKISLLVKTQLNVPTKKNHGNNRFHIETAH